LKAEDRVRCVVAEALLRQIPGFSPEKLTKTPKGKPCFGDGGAVHFNLSHSGQWVVIAYGSRPVGIDVEKICWDSGKENLARRYFTADEQDYVFGRGPQGCAARFFEIWTAKESYLKYIGTGLRKALDSFSVLQINVPNRLAFQPDIGYSLCLWSEEERVDKTVISVSELLEVI
jgi:4'-phosphopantetheinyl transferase